MSDNTHYYNYSNKSHNLTKVDKVKNTEYKVFFGSHEVQLLSLFETEQFRQLS